MIDCVFTIDYEIYGDGGGSLKRLIHEPAEQLISLFQKYNSKFVCFVEVAELEIIENAGTDRSIELIRNQIRYLDKEGFELGLHIHPQWYNAKYEKGKWNLDYAEYNLCALRQTRISSILERSIKYLRGVVDKEDFKPLSFRAGNWLFQPTGTAAGLLVEKGIKIDSSVFKGGLQRRHGLDYRKAAGNSYYWMFSDDVTVPDHHGTLLELPIYTKMVPFWKMPTSKRIGMQQRSSQSATGKRKRIWDRLPDYLRWRYPLKFDYCRMTMDELFQVVDAIIAEDRRDPISYRPVIAIGHTKDLVDFGTIECLLSYLVKQGVALSTFDKVYRKLAHHN